MLAIACFGLAAILTGCDQTEVSTEDLAHVVERDGVPFVVQSIPGTVIDRLAAHQVILVGETHLIREHRELMAELVRTLHAWGFRQLLLEWPHMLDWLLRDFAEDRQLEPNWAPPTWLYGDLLTAIRDFNRLRRPDERVVVRGIDVNLNDYGGAQEFVNSLRALSQHLVALGPLQEFLEGGYRPEKVETLRRQLEANRSLLVASWGQDWYDTVAEMVEVELASVSIRAQRNDHYDLSVRLRENVMKRLADLRLEGYPHRSMINVGANHAQKEYLRGTNQEWLGDYLVHKSTAVGGPVVVVAVMAARITSGSGASVVYDILDASPENELFRLMHEAWPDQIVFLPLDDPVFLAGGVPVNFEGMIQVSALKEQYDALMQLPLARRVPLQ
jgi:hypothetical protein